MFLKTLLVWLSPKLNFLRGLCWFVAGLALGIKSLVLGVSLLAVAVLLNLLAARVEVSARGITPAVQKPLKSKISASDVDIQKMLLAAMASANKNPPE